MNTWHRVATLLLVTVSTVAGQTGLPLPGCSASPTWNISENTNVLGGISVSGVNLDTCKQLCASNSSCTGIDWDANPSPASCYLNLAPNGFWRIGQALGVTHYQLVSRGDPDCAPSVCYSWELLNNTNVLGGTANDAKTVDDCQSACQNDALCVGIDFDLTYQSCYLSRSTQIRTAPGVAHYNLIRTTGDNCNAGCVLYIKSGSYQGRVLTINSDQSVGTSDDLSAAAVFLPTRCLIDSSWTMFNNCYSYQLREKPGYYLRARANILYVHKYNETFTEVIPQRFSQDSSFKRRNIVSAGLSVFSLMTVSMDGYFISGSVISPYESQLYCVTPPLPSTSSIIIKESCPVVWNRIRGAKTINHAYHSNTDSLEQCRQRCTTNPFCMGVIFRPVISYNSGYVTFPVSPDDKIIYRYTDCYHVATPDASNRLIVQDSDRLYDYYELQRRMPGTCRSGCQYAWRKTTTAGAGVWTCGMGSRVQCIIYADCVGITTQCNNVYQNGPTPDYALIRAVAACGRCVNSFATVYNATDSSATLIGSSYTDSQCRTVCVNNNLCVGYELRDSNVCCISKQSATLTQPSPYHHVDIIRPQPTCGNGCVHDWVLKAYTSMEHGPNGATYYSPATTDKACREACISNPLCTGIDWVYGPSSTACWLGLSSNIRINYEKTLYTDHFELKRDNECE